MISHMWISVDDAIPHGCIPLEIMFDDDRVKTCCSCDLHWGNYLGKKEMPLYFREELTL